MNFDCVEFEETAPKPEEPLFEVHEINPSSPKVERAPAFVEGIAFPGYTNISGPPKSCKTIIALAQALAIHTGRPFLDRETVQANCFWLQLDMGEADFQNYSERLAVGMLIPARPMPYVAERVVDLVKPAHQEALLRELAERGTEILYIDSGRAAASLDEDSSGEVRDFVRGFLLGRLRNENGISTVVISHSPKGRNGPRGSGEWTAAADSIWEVCRDEEHHAGELEDDPDLSRNYLKLAGRGRHAPLDLRLLVKVGEGRAKVQEIRPSDVRKERFDLRVKVALEALHERPGGLTQTQVGQVLKEAGVGVRKAELKGFVDELLRRSPVLGEREEVIGKNLSRRIFINESGEHQNEFAL